MKEVPFNTLKAGDMFAVSKLQAEANNFPYMKINGFLTKTTNKMEFVYEDDALTITFYPFGIANKVFIKD